MADLLSAFWKDSESGPPLFSPREWESLLGQARNAGLLARLSVHFSSRQWMPSVPTKARVHLEGALHLVKRQRHEVTWEVSQIQRALREISEPVVLLKGAAYLLTGLPPAQGRLFSDIDIMVPNGKLRDAERLLYVNGWENQERDAYNQRYYREWMHEIPPLRHVHRGSVIDLHHTISPRTSKFRIDSDLLFKRLQPTKLDGLFVLDPADMVLHSASHLYQEGEFDHALRDLLDMRDLIEHFSKRHDFWQKLFSQANELGLGEPLFHMLYQIERLFGLGAPQNCVGDVNVTRPGWINRFCLTRLLGVAFVPNHPDSDTRLTGLVRWLLYVRSHGMRMPPHLLIPHLIRKSCMAQIQNRGEQKNA
jgi:hypothetical protein